ncbi:hypothetical protein K1X76_04100 [bacterium]|nr:hypothetical protein [bacterium]
MKPGRVVSPQAPYDSYFKFTCPFCSSNHTLVLRGQVFPSSVLCSVCKKESNLANHKARQVRRHEVNHEAKVYDYMTKTTHEAWVLDTSPRGARIALLFSPKSQQLYKIMAKSFTAIFEARWVIKKNRLYESGVEFHEFWPIHNQGLIKDSIE